LVFGSASVNFRTSGIMPAIPSVPRRRFIGGTMRRPLLAYIARALGQETATPTPR
jgi:hypothetical protein